MSGNVAQFPDAWASRSERSFLKTYRAWCAQQDVEPFPDDGSPVSAERILLRFLHDHAEVWGLASMRQLAGAIAKHRLFSGLSDPRGLRYAAYLDFIKRSKGATVCRPTDAFTSAQVKQFADCRAGLPKPTTPDEEREVTRDVAYLLVGVGGALRHIDLERLRVGQIEEADDGYAFTIHDHKGARLQSGRGGASKPWPVAIEHSPPDETGACFSWCPACALSRQLRQRRADGAGEHERLFVSPGQSSLSRYHGHRIASRVWLHLASDGGLEDGVEAKLGTRMPRVTAATLAVEAGASLPDTRDFLHHASVNTTSIYVRRRGLAAAEEFTLPF